VDLQRDGPRQPPLRPHVEGQDGGERELRRPNSGSSNSSSSHKESPGPRGAGQEGRRRKGRRRRRRRGWR